MAKKSSYTLTVKRSQFVIAVKFSGHMLGEYFMNVDEDGQWWTTEYIKRAQVFDNFDAAAEVYRKIEERAARMGIYLCIISK